MINKFNDFLLITENRKTKEEFIEEARSKYDNKFDYSKVDFKGVDQKVIIICPIHGEKIMTPYNHLRSKYGCPDCGEMERANNRTMSKEEFIKRAMEIHGDRYNYSKVNYQGTKTKVIITCLLHGDFKQAPEKHIYQKSGCPICSHNKHYTTESFISKAKEINGDRYNYDLVNYINNNTDVMITCKKHNPPFNFEQRPNNHLAGNGCPRCNDSKGEKRIIQYLIINDIKYVAQKKFPDCKLIHPLPFDFYVPEQNLCIEYDGEQHFGLSGKFTHDEYEHLKIRDEIKNKYCRDKGIKLLRIKYTDYDNIENILDSYLN